MRTTHALEWLPAQHCHSRIEETDARVVESSNKDFGKLQSVILGPETWRLQDDNWSVLWSHTTVQEESCDNLWDHFSVD